MLRYHCVVSWDGTNKMLERKFALSNNIPQSFDGLLARGHASRIAIRYKRTSLVIGSHDSYGLDETSLLYFH